MQPSSPPRCTAAAHRSAFVLRRVLRVIARPVPVPYTAACPASCAHFTMMNAAPARSLPTPPPLAAGSATPATYRIESHDCRVTSRPRQALPARLPLGAMHATAARVDATTAGTRLRGGSPQRRHASARRHTGSHPPPPPTPQRDSGSRTSLPPIYGRSTSGTVTEPSSF